MTDANKVFIDQTVIQGTLRTEDLVDAFTDEYERLGGKSSNVELFRSHLLLPEGEGGWDGKGYVYSREEELAYDLEALFELLSELAPDGTTFGSHPGDGADFGFWTYEEILPSEGGDEEEVNHVASI